MNIAIVASRYGYLFNQKGENMNEENRIARLEAELRSFKRLVACLTIVMIAGLCIVAAEGKNDQAIRGKLSILDEGGLPKTILHPNGDIEVGGSLKVKGVDIAKAIEAIKKAYPDGFFTFDKHNRLVEITGTLKVKGLVSAEEAMLTEGLKAKRIDSRVVVIRDTKENATISLAEINSNGFIMMYHDKGTRELRLDHLTGKWLRDGLIKP